MVLIQSLNNMQTLTAEQFKEKYGEVGVSSFTQPTKGTGESVYQSVITGAEKGAVETLGTLSDIGGAIANQTAGRVVNAIQGKGFKPTQSSPNLLTQRDNPALKAQNTGEKIGKVIEFGLEAGLPLEKVALKGIDIAKEFALGSKALKATGNAVKTGENVVNKAGDYAVSRVPKLLGIFTGESDDVIKNALKNPEVANKGIEAGDEALRQVVAEGSQNSIQIRKAFNDAYSAAFKDITKDVPGKFISRQKVLYDFVDSLQAQGVKASKGQLDFTTSRIAARPGEAAKINAAYNAIINWTDWSLKGTNELKQIVGELTRFANEAGGTSKSPFLGTFYHTLDTSIRENLPEKSRLVYDSINKNYSENIDMYNDVVEAFNSGDPFTKLANALSKNKDTMRGLLEFYEKKTGKSVLPIVAGRELAMEKTAAFGLLNPRSWIDLLVSPKIQAKLVTEVGKLK